MSQGKPENSASQTNQSQSADRGDSPRLDPERKPVLTQEVDVYVEFEDSNTLPPRPAPLNANRTDV
jgi:hypothetical protein